MRNVFKFCPLCKGALEKRQVDNHERLVCSKCGWIYYENPLPVAVCLARNEDGKILVTKRNLQPGKDQWALPGGFVESGEKPEVACLRELEEETGLKGSFKRLIGVYLQNTDYYGFLIVIGYEVTVLNNHISLNNELKEAKFFSKEDLPHIPFLSHRQMIKEVFKDL